MVLLEMSLQTSVIEKQNLDYIDIIESHGSWDFLEKKITWGGERGLELNTKALHHVRVQEK